MSASATALGDVTRDPGSPPLELPPVAQSRLRAFAGRFGYPLFVAVEFAMFLLLWEYATGVTGAIDPVFLPPPSKTITALVDLTVSGTLPQELRFSATTWVVGYGLAAITGVIIGVVMGTVQPIGRLLGPIAWSLYATPHIAIRPMLVIWFGFGMAPVIALVFVSAIFPILLTTAAGIRTVDGSLIRAGQVFGASWWQLQRKIVLPATLPFVVTGLRLAIPTSLIGMLVGEILGTGRGLGSILALGTATFRVDQAIAAIVVLVVTSLTLLRLFAMLERRVAPWRASEPRS